MKNDDERATDRRLELDTEVIADLEATDADTGAIRGGASGSTNSKVDQSYWNPSKASAG